MQERQKKIVYFWNSAHVFLKLVFIAPNVYPHFYQFRWKKETTSILLHLEKRLDAQCAKIVPER